MASEDGPVVELAPGTRALGRSMGPAKSCSSSVSAFLGLPYAAPPVGPLRYAPPEPIDLWTGDRDATKHGAVSPQAMEMWAKLPGKIKIITPTNISEACLFLNVWTPVLKSDAKKPVMVFIHGGGFQGGYADLYYGTSLVGLGDVVLVTINYRIGAYGFMTTGDDVMPGNYGILDQIEALKWVKKNISAFGGDPDNVTIFGESAGSVSVSALLFTSRSKGLFHRAICESGTVQAPWALRSSQAAFQANKHYLEALGCTSSDSTEILAFLRNVPADDLQKAVTPMCILAPVVDGDVFRTEDLQTSGNTLHPDVDVIIGVNNDEGVMFAFMFGNVSFPDKESVRKAMAGMATPAYQDKTEAATSELVEEYCDDSQNDEGRLKAFAKMLGDWFFTYGTLKAIDVQAKSPGRSYLYWYQYREPLSHYPEWVRADHGSELQIVFGHRMMKEEISEQMSGLDEVEDCEESEEVSRKVISLWTNFAKTGNPNGDGLPEWPQYTTETREHLIIDSTFSIGRDMMADKAAFWDQFVAKFPTRPSE